MAKIRYYSLSVSQEVIGYMKQHIQLYKPAQVAALLRHDLKAWNKYRELMLSEHADHAFDLTGFDLQNLNLSGTSLSLFVLTGANLAGSNLSGTILLRVSFMEANLKGVCFRGADLVGVNFMGADLTDVDLTDARINEDTCFDRTVGLDTETLDYIELRRAVYRRQGRRML